MKSMKIALLGAIALITAPCALALDSIVTDTTITGSTTSNWVNHSKGNSVANSASIGFQTTTDSAGKVDSFTKEYNWSQSRSDSVSVASGNQLDKQNTKVMSYNNGLNTFGTMDSKSVSTKNQLIGHNRTVTAVNGGSFKVSVNGHGGVKFKDGKGAPNSFGGKSGSLVSGVANSSPVRPELSFDITNTQGTGSKGFVADANQGFTNATVWVPQVNSGELSKGKQNKASMSFTQSSQTLVQEQQDIKGTTTTTSLTSGSFLN